MCVCRFRKATCFGSTLSVRTETRYASGAILFLIWIELPMGGGIFFSKVRDTVSVVLAVVPLQLKLGAKVSFTEET